MTSTLSSSNGAGDQELTLQVEYQVSEWSLINGVAWPRLAYRDTRSGTSGMQVTRCVISRPAAPSLLEQTNHLDELFRYQIQNGELVDDRRSRLAYVVGEQVVTIDGHLFRLPEPITSDPTIGLADLVAATGYQSRPALISESARSSVYIFVLAAGIALVTGLGVEVVRLVLRKHKRHRDKAN